MAVAHTDDVQSAGRTQAGFPVATLKGIEDVLMRLNNAWNSARIPGDDERGYRSHQHAGWFLGQQQHAVVGRLTDQLERRSNA